MIGIFFPYEVKICNITSHRASRAYLFWLAILKISFISACNLNRVCADRDSNPGLGVGNA